MWHKLYGLSEYVAVSDGKFRPLQSRVSHKEHRSTIVYSDDNDYWYCYYCAENVSRMGWWGRLLVLRETVKYGLEKTAYWVPSWFTLFWKYDVRDKTKEGETGGVNGRYGWKG